MESAHATASLCLTVAGTGDRVHLVDHRVVVAGYTGRDGTAVQAHIDELAHIGVAPPPRVPMFYELDSGIVTADQSIDVAGYRTSGEVEPILVFGNGRVYLGVGSDHTDRDLETRSIADSKAAAPKPVGTSVVPLDAVHDRWDEITIVCRLDGESYQEGRLSAMLPPDELLDKLAETGAAINGDAVVFCGTLPLLTSEFVYGTQYELEMRLPGGGVLAHSYVVTTKPTVA